MAVRYIEGFLSVKLQIQEFRFGSQAGRINQQLDKVSLNFLPGEWIDPGLGAEGFTLLPLHRCWNRNRRLLPGMAVTRHGNLFLFQTKYVDNFTPNPASS
jgi:hypothetical protein